MNDVTLLAAVHLQHAEARGGRHGGHGGELAVGAMEGQDLAQVHVGQPVPVGDHEGVPVHVALHALDARAGHGLGTGLGQRDLVVLFIMRVVVHDLALAAERDGEVVVHLLVVEEVVPDHVTAVTQAKHELAEAVVGVDLHDVPQNGPAADFDHGLGAKVGLFA